MNTTRVVPTDAALPALSALFEPDHGELRYVRYRPGRDCTVVWSTRSNGHLAQLVSARLFNDERGLRQQAFPGDHRLRGLGLASSAPWVAKQLGALGLLDEGASPVVEVLPDSYKPGIRCVLRYLTHDPDRRLLCMAKVSRDDEPQQSVEGIRRFAMALSAAHAPWGIAAPIAAVPDINLLLVEPIDDAMPVADLLERAIDDATALPELDDAIRRAADGLAVFQLGHVPELPTVDPASRVIELDRKVERVSQVVPELAGWLEAPLRSLRRALEDLPPERTVLSHGSFRHEHLLLSGARMAAVDLDNLCRSGASADAGSFLAFLDVEAVADPRCRGVAEHCAATFTSTLAAADHHDPAWVAWHRAAGQLKWALRCFFSLSPRWPERTEALARLATDTLETAAQPC